MPSNEILSVRRAYKMDGEYAVRCPHCSAPICIEGDDLSEIHGEQYQCRCDGWFQVETDARYAGRMPDE